MLSHILPARLTYVEQSTGYINVDIGLMDQLLATYFATFEQMSISNDQSLSRETCTF